MYHAGLLNPDGSAGTMPGKSQSDEPPLPVQTGFHVEADDYANTKLPKPPSDRLETAEPGSANKQPSSSLREELAHNTQRKGQR